MSPKARAGVGFFIAAGAVVAGLSMTSTTVLGQWFFGFALICIGIPIAVYFAVQFKKKEPIDHEQLLRQIRAENGIIEEEKDGKK